MNLEMPRKIGYVYLCWLRLLLAKSAHNIFTTVYLTENTALNPPSDKYKKVKACMFYWDVLTLLNYKLLVLGSF